MKTIYHVAASRGHANHGWLDSYHTFSFANYYDANRMGFGALRVLNDDTVAKGMGFGQHPHRDMEIISIPLEGGLKHGDNMGNSGVIVPGQIQVMSAGTGVVHSEMNASATDAVKFLQIWVIPNKQGVTPRYDEITLTQDSHKNKLRQIISPNQDDEGLWIHQDAWFYWADFDKNQEQTYRLNIPKNGVYAFVIEGQVKIGDQILEKRDGLGIWDTDAFDFETMEDSVVLFMEVPI